MGPTWGRQDPGGPHVGPMILAIWEVGYSKECAIVTSDIAKIKLFFWEIVNDSNSQWLIVWFTMYISQ